MVNRLTRIDTWLLLVCAALVHVFGMPACVFGAEQPEEEVPEKITYEQHVQPIFRAACFSCHNQDKKSSDLDLTSHTELMVGGSSGEVLDPGNPDESWLYLLVTHQEEPHMPPEGDRLSDEQLETIRRWILGGALANSASEANLPTKPKFDLSLQGASVGRPDGPPSMPHGLTLEPVVRTDTTTAVTAIATSPWAPLFAVAGQKQVLLYHSDTRELLGVLPFPEGVAQTLKFSRNGKLLLAGGGRAGHSGRAVVWDVETGERVVEIGDEYDAVLAADISSDQTMIALGGPGKVIRVYSTADGELAYEINKHTDWIYSLAFSPDSVLLATADRNGGMFVWEAYTGREYLSLRGHGGAITEVSWRDDSNVLASCSEDGSIRIWEMQNGGQIKSWGAHGGGVLSMKFAHDGRLASCGRDRVAKVWDQNGAQQRAFEAFGDLAVQVTFNHDGSLVAAGDWSGEVRVWTTADGARVGRLPTNPLTIAEHLENAQQELALRKPEYDALAEQAVTAQAVAEKAGAELTAAQKTATDAALAAQAAAAAAAQAKAVADKAAMQAKTVRERIPPKDVAAAALADAAAKAKQAAAAEPENESLSVAAANTQVAADLVADDLAETKKQAETLAATAAQTAKQSQVAGEVAEKAAAGSAEAAQRVETLRPPAQAAAQQAAEAAVNAENAAAALETAKRRVKKWTAAAQLDQLLKQLAERQSDYERLAGRAARAQAAADKAAEELEAAKQAANQTAAEVQAASDVASEAGAVAETTSD